MSALLIVPSQVSSDRHGRYITRPRVTNGHTNNRRSSDGRRFRALVADRAAAQRPSRSFQGAGSPLECRRSATHQPQRKTVRRQQAPSRVQPLMALYISGMEAAVSCRSSSGRDAGYASCSRILLHYCTERFTTVSSLRAQAVSLGNVGSIVPIRPLCRWWRVRPVKSAVCPIRISLVGAVEGVRKSRHHRPRSKLTVEAHLDTIREAFR